MAPLRTTPRTRSSADSTAGSTTIATCQIEKSTGQSNKCASPSWLKLFRHVPREWSGVRKVPGDTVQMPHPLCKLRKMVDGHLRRHLLIWRFGGILDSFKKPRIGLHRTWPEADDNSSEDVVHRNPPGEAEECEGCGVGSSITNPIMLDDEPAKREGRGGGSSLSDPIIVEDDDDEYSDDKDQYSDDAEDYSDIAGEYFRTWSDLGYVQDSGESQVSEDRAVDQGSDRESDIYERPGPFLTAYCYIPKT